MNEKPCILFVDDHEDTRFLIACALGRLGYEVVGTDCPSEALRLARESRFDLYILDSRFAEGSGLELCASIREFDAETPIVFFTGVDPSLLNASLDCDAQGFVMKPQVEELPKVIERVLSAAA